MGKAYFISKLNSDTKAALLHLPTCTGVLQGSWQREVSFIPLCTSCPTPGWATESVVQLILPQDAHELLYPRGASIRSGYSCSVNPLWYGRAISPGKLLSWALQPLSPAESSQTTLGAQTPCTPHTERTAAPCHVGLHPCRDTLLHEKSGMDDTPPRIGQAVKGKKQV